MHQIIERSVPLVENTRNCAIKFFTKKYLEYSIDNVLINNVFLTTIHNHIDWNDARYRYLEKIPHTIVAIIYHLTLALFSFIIITFKLETAGLCKKYCINSILQIIMSIASLYLSVLGSISPSSAMNTTLFYGEKIIEIFQTENDEIVSICAFIKNFWEAHYIGIQNWMTSANPLPSQDGHNHSREFSNMHEQIENLSDIKNLFQSALRVT